VAASKNETDRRRSGPECRRYRTGRVRILVTNDDGVHAPGLAALVRALGRWAGEHGHEVVVTAPLANYSGAAAAVGTVYEREAIGFRVVRIEGAEGVPVYGLDAPPALSVIIGAYGAFGDPPDLVVSGINLGVNVGRSVLHSGTVGAALTAAQRGFRALAVSMRSRPEHHWDTATALTLEILPVLARAPERTVLNLNVPSIPLHELQGVTAAPISDAGIVQGARSELAERDAGTVFLTLGTAVPTLGDTSGRDPTDDASLVGAGFATLTALHGVGEDRRPESRLALEEALVAAGGLLSR
jgi:5'-nucleotidase